MNRLFVFAMLFLGGLQFSVTAMANPQNQSGATYCQEMAISKEPISDNADSEFLRLSDRIFFAAIEVTQFEVKGRIFEIHEWSPLRSEKLIPCELESAKINIPIGEIGDDESIEDVAITVKSVAEKLSSFRPRIIKVVAGSTISGEKYWSRLKQEIEWKSNLSPLEISARQELVYAVLSDVHLPRLDACVSNYVWSDAANATPWALYCKKLVCNPEATSSDILVNQFCSVPNSKISYLERMALFNDALEVEEYQYLYANLASTGYILGFASSNFQSSDAYVYSGSSDVGGQNELRSSHMRNSKGEQRPEITPDANFKDWTKTYRKIIKSKKSLRVVGGDAFAYALATDMEQAANAFSELDFGAFTWLCISSYGGKNGSMKAKPILDSSASPVVAIGKSIIHKEEMSGLLWASGVVTKFESNQAGGGVQPEQYRLAKKALKTIQADQKGFPQALFQINSVLNSAEIDGDADNYKKLIQSTATFIDDYLGVTDSHLSRARPKNSCLIEFPLPTSGSWLRGFVSTVDPRNEPAIRR